MPDCWHTVNSTTPLGLSTIAGETLVDARTGKKVAMRWLVCCSGVGARLRVLGYRGHDGVAAHAGACWITAFALYGSMLVKPNPS